ncbi:Gamma-interferon inducible lysosomal thiol reductase [Danaus plexippus plexippus]|uniref:Gamma-interferon inducible lysosomal thiol reductase n=1 Tax=Danaus plexippus plexippus TaxID=278856 RepID=A0A212EMW0_DANPL|nr:Gamma-interferon inducible lysosomal thiol reductase [Danaus plexippus plexippus]
MLLKLLFLLLFVVIDRCVSSGSQKLLLSVYYESNCPDSKAFILNQLQPAFQLLHDHMTIKFVPFGKAKSINFGDGGFQCQHGPSECLGNIVQDCSLHYMNEQPDKDKLTYVACEIKTRSASQGRFDCVEKANLPTNLIDECIFHGKGTSLQLESEYLTSLVNHKFIPTVTINGVYDQQFQDDAQVDLIGTLCSLLKGVQPCSQYYNYMALRNLMSTKYPMMT